MPGSRDPSASQPALLPSSVRCRSNTAPRAALSATALPTFISNDTCLGEEDCEHERHNELQSAGCLHDLRGQAEREGSAERQGGRCGKGGKEVGKER